LYNHLFLPLDLTHTLILTLHPPLLLGEGGGGGGCRVRIRVWVRSRGEEMTRRPLLSDRRPQRKLKKVVEFEVDVTLPNHASW
jgi:hypothetical protein